MTTEQINKIIHEARGLCWHTIERPNKGGRFEMCPMCNVNLRHYRDGGCGMQFTENPSYTTSWADYGEALEWAKASEWWDDFIGWLIRENDLWDAESAVIVIFDLLTCMECHSEHGAGILAEYIIAHPEHFGKEAP